MYMFVFYLSIFDLSIYLSISTTVTDATNTYKYQCSTAQGGGGSFKDKKHYDRKDWVVGVSMSNSWLECSMFDWHILLIFMMDSKFQYSCCFHLFVRLMYLTAYLPVHPCYLSIFLSICLSSFLSAISICLFVYLFVCLCVYLSLYLSILMFMSTYLFIYLI